MSPDTPLFGRITCGSNRVSLGRGGTPILLARAMEQIRKLRPSEETVIHIELSRSKLLDSTQFDKLSVMEQQLATRVIADPDAPSPFEGLTIGRVAEAMASFEYEAYAEICNPDKRIGVSSADLAGIKSDYESKFPDCLPHFPKWLD